MTTLPDPAAHIAPFTPGASPAPTVAVHLYQIAYSPESLAGIPDGWLILDNQDNARPDWFEYWPIRRHLLEQT